jgi:hypothetical protein
MHRLTRTCLALFLLASLAACPSGDEGSSDEASETAQTDTTAGECVPPDGVYGNCITGGDAACMASGAPYCVTDTIDNPSIGVCTRRCDEVCDCWAAPSSGTAEVACTALVAGDPSKSCVLDCSSGQTCPDGMECLDPLQICVWPG